MVLISLFSSCSAAVSMELPYLCRSRLSDECSKKEDQYLADCIDTLPGRSPDTMSAVMLDTQQYRMWTCVCRLQRCRELHRVGGNRPEIVFRRRDKRSGIRFSSTHIVQRRIREQRAELLIVSLSIPVFCHQVCANGETMIAQHIRQGTLAHHRSEQLWMLYQARGCK